MIRPGWKRDVCPQCHMPGRLWERWTEAQIANKSLERGVDSVFMRVDYTVLGMEGHADFCDNCGVMYLYRAVPVPTK